MNERVFSIYLLLIRGDSLHEFLIWFLLVALLIFINFLGLYEIQYYFIAFYLLLLFISSFSLCFNNISTKSRIYLKMIKLSFLYFFHLNLILQRSINNNDNFFQTFSLDLIHKNCK